MTPRGVDELAELVVGHLSEVLAGTCTITREQIEAHAEDRSFAEILSGIYFLHQDLLYRESERARAEAELQAAVARLEAQNHEVEESRAALAALATELSIPIIKVWRGVLMVPLIGAFDAARAQDMMGRLLAAVIAEKANRVIIDLTGVTQVDEETADRFLAVVGALRMLGARSIIAGIPPAVALAIVRLDLDLSAVVATRDVQEALTYSMDR
jgi:anti-anti-sigma regulatory factor